MKRLKRLIRAAMFGDCDNCGHSFAYHMPMMGCIKMCGCLEFR